MNLDDIKNNKIKKAFEFENKKFIAFEKNGFLINDKRILSKYKIDLDALKKINNRFLMLNDSLFLDVETNKIHNYFQLSNINLYLNKNNFYFYKEINDFVISDVDLEFHDLPKKIENTQKKIYLIDKVMANKKYNISLKAYIYNNKIFLSSGNFIDDAKEIEKQHKTILLSLNL